MKHLRETFTEEEWKILKQIKEVSRLNWHDFLIQATIRYALTIKYKELAEELAKTVEDPLKFKKPLLV